MNFGEKMKALRGARSKREVAADLDISESSYTKYERNERIPRDDIKLKIACYFGRTVQEIFFSDSEHI